MTDATRGTCADSELIVEDRDDGVRLVTLNRPAKLNALTEHMWDGLVEIFRDTTVTDARCIVLTGAGRAFSSGHDLAGQHLADTSGDSSPDLYAYQYDCDVPVISAVRGWAAGGGAGLVLCSTIRLATPSAKILYPQINFGLHGMSGPAILSRMLPANVALEVTLTGEPIGATDMHRLGLVNRIVDEDELMPEALSLASTIASKDPETVRAIRSTIRSCESPPNLQTRLGTSMKGHLARVQAATG